jgi:hypothetical protein
MNASPADAASLTPAALMTRALGNAARSGWVHEVERATAPGHRFSMDNDIGTSESRQVIDGDEAHAEVLVIKKTAYLYGDEKAVADYFQLSSNDPAKYANKWLSFSSTSSGYAAVSQAVTLASDFSNVSIPGKLGEGPVVTIDAQKAVPLHGTAAATWSTTAIKATPCITKSTPIVPVELRLVSKTETVTATWSKWGHRVVLSVPPHATPLTQP